MPIITEEQPYNGALQRVVRLGLAPIVSEVRSLLTGFTLLVKEAKDTNGGAAVRKLVDGRFEKAAGWVKKQSGDVD